MSIVETKYAPSDTLECTDTPVQSAGLFSKQVLGSKFQYILITQTLEEHLLFKKRLKDRRDFNRVESGVATEGLLSFDEYTKPMIESTYGIKLKSLKNCYRFALWLDFGRHYPIEWSNGLRLGGGVSIAGFQYRILQIIHTKETDNGNA